MTSTKRKMGKTIQTNILLNIGIIVILVLVLRQLYKEYTYSVTAKNNFILYCETTTNNKPLCNCVWNQVKKEYSLKEFTALEQSFLLTGLQIPPKYQEIIDDCQLQDKYGNL